LENRIAEVDRCGAEGAMGKSEGREENGLAGSRIRRLAVMSIREFSAYFDESGTKADTVAVVVAGFIAPAEQWIAFEHDWKRILSMFKVSSLHMRDFAHSKGEFIT